MSEQTTIEFIKAHKSDKLSDISLLLNKKPLLDKEFILAQINGFQKAKTKIPEFNNTPNILYPSKLSLEQCSSEKTGSYKSKLIKGKTLLDLTGGFGVDSYYFSKEFKQVTYIEKNADLFLAVKHNFKCLHAMNIKLVNSTAEDFIKTAQQKYNLIYIDPSRRNKNQRVFKLNECTPNIIDLSQSLFEIADKILIKTAPLLDIKLTLKDLKYVSKVWVISVQNDCKEVLYLLEKDNNSEAKINTINLLENNQKFNFNYAHESNAIAELSEPINYLYEPNSAILKAGAFNSVSKRYQVKKLAQHTHLYTSEKNIKDFPGRAFKIKATLPYSIKAVKKLKLINANVSCRNFKHNVEQVKQKLKLKDGGKTYLFAATNMYGKPILIICVK